MFRQNLWSFVLIYCFFDAIQNPASAAVPDINRRNQCEKWQYVPANEALDSPSAALLFCDDSEVGYWLALKVTCRGPGHPVAITYSPGYAFGPGREEKPTAQLLDAATNETWLENEDSVVDIFDLIPFANADTPGRGISAETTDSTMLNAMLSFSTGGPGYHHIVQKSSDKAWVLRLGDPNYPLFRTLYFGSFVDLTLDFPGTTERYPLRGSHKAIQPVATSCRPI